ncbi:type II toxin-antitoxin system RelE/ParE family toxin [Candidatus Woesearchaeota archaeon]|nr:type II toxin-antitoxin system RelE/ParE family toxin [Candidatus Woesearchaeota archaeon]
MYEIVFSDTALKELKKLEKVIQERILVRLNRIRVRPEVYVKRLVGEPYYSMRIGDYRVILDIQRGKLIIMIVTLGHRKNIYGRL